MNLVVAQKYPDTELQESYSYCIANGTILLHCWSFEDIEISDASDEDFFHLPQETLARRFRDYAVLGPFSLNDAAQDEASPDDLALHVNVRVFSKLSTGGRLSVTIDYDYRGSKEELDGVGEARRGYSGGIEMCGRHGESGFQTLPTLAMNDISKSHATSIPHLMSERASRFEPLASTVLSPVESAVLCDARDRHARFVLIAESLPFGGVPSQSDPDKVLFELKRTVDEDPASFIHKWRLAWAHHLLGGHENLAQAVTLMEGLLTDEPANIAARASLREMCFWLFRDAVKAGDADAARLALDSFLMSHPTKDECSAAASCVSDWARDIPVSQRNTMIERLLRTGMHNAADPPERALRYLGRLHESFRDHFESHDGLEQMFDEYAQEAFDGLKQRWRGLP